MHEQSAPPEEAFDSSEHGIGSDRDLDRPESQDPIEVRHEVINALQENEEPMTDTELASVTARDLETVRETLTDLADDQIVEVTYESKDPSEDPSPTAPTETETPPDQMTGRLSAL